MAWADLNAEQQNQVQTYDRQVRALAGELARFCARLQVMVDYHDSTVGPLLTTVAGDTIPSNSGLAGIELKSGTFMNAVDAAFVTLLADNYTAADRQTYIELAGPENVLP